MTFSNGAIHHVIGLLVREADYIDQHVEKIPEGGCWIWMSGLANSGYGQGRTSLYGGERHMHRYSYALYKGEIPKGKAVLHTCDNKECCNPHHLYLGSMQDNARDRVNRGRQAKGERLPQAKLTEEDVRYIRASSIKGATLARMYNVNPATISFIRTNRNWKGV